MSGNTNTATWAFVPSSRLRPTTNAAMQAPTGITDASQSSGDPAPQAPTGSNIVIDTIDKGLELTNTLAAIVKEVAEVLQHAPYVKTLTGVILQFIKIRDVRLYFSGGIPCVYIDVEFHRSSKRTRSVAVKL
jgi:hypothetical protein